MKGDQMVPRLGKMKKKGYKGKNKKEQLKVVYISSPMKVKTSASRFRSLVQQLTGKNSDISQYMDDSDYGSRDVYREIDCDDQTVAKETSDYSSLSRDDTCTSLDSFPGPKDNVFTYEKFAGISSMNDSFYHPWQIDVLGSFDELI